VTVEMQVKFLLGSFLIAFIIGAWMFRGAA